MSNNLSVRITADVTDLQVKFAVAKAEVNGLTSEMNKLAKASVNGALDPAASSRLQQVAGDLLKARQEAGQYASALSKAGVASSSMSGATQEMHGSISTATREFRALFDELSSGRTRQTPGTLAIIAQRVLGLQAGTLLAVGGVGALAAGLGYLAVRAVEASNAIDKIHVASLEAGNDISRTQFSQLADQLAKLPGVSSSAARDIVSAFSGLNMPVEAFTAATRLAAEQMVATGEKAGEVGKQMARALNPDKSAVDVAKEIGSFTQAQVDAARAADASGNANAILAEKLTLLNAQLARARGATDEYSRSFGQSAKGFLDWIGMTQAGLTPQQANTEIVREQADAYRKNAQAIQQSAAALSRAPAKQNIDYTSAKERQQQIDKMQEESGALSTKIENERAEGAQKLEQLNARVAEEQLRYQLQIDDMQRTSEDLSTKIANERDEGARKLEQLNATNAEEEIERQRQLDQLVEQSQALSTKIMNERAAGEEKLHALDMKIAEESAAKWRTVSGAITSSMGQAIEGLIIKHESLRQAATQVATGIAQAFAKTAAQNITTMLEQAVVGKTLRAQEIRQDAGSAAAGAYKAIVGIPYVGPFLAPAAAAVAYAGVLAFDSAEGGYDIPAGRNPITQLHQREMVLPAPIADTIRNRMGDGEGGGGETHFHGDMNVAMADTNMRRLLSNRQSQRQIARSLSPTWRGRR